MLAHENATNKIDMQAIKNIIKYTPSWVIK